MRSRSRAAPSAACSAAARPGSARADFFFPGLILPETWGPVKSHGVLLFISHRQIAAGEAAFRCDAQRTDLVRSLPAVLPGRALIRRADLAFIEPRPTPLRSRHESRSATPGRERPRGPVERRRSTRN